jgi:hypothetical protein
MCMCVCVCVCVCVFVCVCVCMCMCVYAYVYVYVYEYVYRHVCACMSMCDNIKGTGCRAFSLFHSVSLCFTLFHSVSLFFFFHSNLARMLSTEDPVLSFLRQSVDASVASDVGDSFSQFLGEALIFFFFSFSFLFSFLLLFFLLFFFSAFSLFFSSFLFVVCGCIGGVGCHVVDTVSNVVSLSLTPPPPPLVPCSQVGIQVMTHLYYAHCIFTTHTASLLYTLHYILTTRTASHCITLHLYYTLTLSPGNGSQRQVDGFNLYYTLHYYTSLTTHTASLLHTHSLTCRYALWCCAERVSV